VTHYDEKGMLVQVGWRWRAKRICLAHDHPFGPWKMDDSVPDDEGLTIEYQPLYILGENTVASPPMLASPPIIRGETEPVWSGWVPTRWRRRAHAPARTD
jgi:hypothetical protein